jgi:peptidoglycan-associated lipoprotein
MNTFLRLGLISVASLTLAACTDPPVDDANAKQATVVDGANGLGNGNLRGVDLNALGAMAALEDDKNYAVGGVQPTIYFGFDRYDVDQQGSGTVAHYARHMNANPQLNVVIEGHCDERGTGEYNMALGERRAKAVRDALVMAGVQASRIRSVSFGEEKPAQEGHDENSWAMNRRAELKFPR